MGVVALSPRTRSAVSGEGWLLEVAVYDLDGYLAEATLTATVTRPDGTTATPTVDLVSVGVYRAEYVFAAAGRHVATVADAGGLGLTTFAAYVDVVADATDMVTLADVVAYMGASSQEETEIQNALDAEAAAQRDVCDVGAVYPAPLREALKRRVQRNLALRSLPFATVPGDGEGSAPIPVPGRDPEVRRLEGPYLRLPAY